MPQPRRRFPRAPVTLAVIACLGLAVGACGTADEVDAPDPACAAYVRYGDLTGTTVTVLEETGGPSGPATPRIGAVEAFERCTGARIAHQGTGSIADRVRAGDPPDLGYVPGPAALGELVRGTGAVKPAAPLVTAHVAEFYPETFKAAGSVDGTLYAAPLDAGVESLVWFPPREFAARGYAVPATWDEMMALSEQIVADGGTPWCAGAAADGTDGAATGWPVVDFLEDALLRAAGPDVFDRWVLHAVPSDSPEVSAALDRVGAILRDPAFVNGGTGDASTVATTPVAAAGLPVARGECFLHRQADTYAAAFPAGTDISADGDVFAFLLPPVDADAGPAALVSGGFAVALADRREVQAFQAYLSSPEWAGDRARASPKDRPGANSGLDPAAVTDPVARLTLDVLQDPRAVLRFDGSDRMPAAVGSGTLPLELTRWLGGAPTADVLSAVEASWPLQ